MDVIFAKLAGYLEPISGIAVEKQYLNIVGK
jgi:hypothetical protein